MDEHERVDIVLRVNALIRATAAQVQQLIKEYADTPCATVAGLTSLWEQAVVTLEMLSEERNRLLGQACTTDPSKQLGSPSFSSSKGWRRPRPRPTAVRIRAGAAEPPTTPLIRDDTRWHVGFGYEEMS